MVWQFLRKLKIELPYDLAIYFPLLGACPQDLKAGVCTPKFIAALFKITKRWKQLKSPSMDEQTNSIGFHL